jgi:hypothetical protein
VYQKSFQIERFKMYNPNMTAALVIVIGLMLAILASDSALRLAFGRGFDLQRWRERPASRWRDVDDLINSRILQGMTRDQVVGMLGEPQRRTAHCFVYKLNEWMMSDALRVRFDERGRVLKARWDMDGC